VAHRHNNGVPVRGGGAVVREGPGTLINTPLPMEFNTPHSTCSSTLIKVPDW
jgi:hypothetical protein